MPQQNDDGQTEPQVRRAVTMRGAASQPASASLRPRTAADPNPGQAEEPSSAAPSSSGSASSERGGDQPTAAAAASSSVSEARSSERSATTSSGADANSSEGSAPSGAGADGSGGGAVGSLSRAEGGTPPGASQGSAGAGGDVPPSGRPTKALLAAAGIGGALLIAAPFLVMGARDDDKTDTAAVAKDATARTLQKDEEETRPGDYAPKPPEVENKAPKSEALKKEEGTPSDEKEEGTPSDEKEKGTPSDEPSPDASPSGEPSSDASPSDESSSESSDAEESSSKSSPPDEPVAKSTAPEAHFLKPRLFLAPEPPPSEPQPQESTPPKEHPGTEPSTAPPEKQEKAKEGSDIKKKVAPPNYANAKGVLLKNVASKLCADVPAFGKGKPDGPVNQFHCNGTDKDNQIWDFEVKEKGKGPRSTDLFQIRNRKDGLCMDLPKFGGQPRGTRVSEFHCNGTTADNQLWWLEPRGDKKFRIHNYASNHQCLKMKTGKDIHPVDARLEIQPCHREGPFEWTF